jgi:hypothetical protein
MKVAERTAFEIVPRGWRPAKHCRTDKDYSEYGSSRLVGKSLSE